MKPVCILVVALVASVAARNGGGRGGGDRGGGGRGDWGKSGGASGQGGNVGSKSGGDRQGGWGRHGGGRHGDFDGNQITVANCTPTNRVIIISDYVQPSNLLMNCVGTCVFQSNAVLSVDSTQTYDKTDSVVIMAGPYSSPNTAAAILSNTPLMAALAGKTNVFVTTIPLYPSITDATIISNVASANALVQTAAATAGVRVIDYQTFYTQNAKYNGNRMNALQICTWIRDQLIALGVVFP